jgi:hypothetical protein
MAAEPSKDIPIEISDCIDAKAILSSYIYSEKTLKTCFLIWVKTNRTGRATVQKNFQILRPPAIFTASIVQSLDLLNLLSPGGVHYTDIPHSAVSVRPSHVASVSQCKPIQIQNLKTSL